MSKKDEILDSDFEAPGASDHEKKSDQILTEIDLIALHVGLAQGEVTGRRSELILPHPLSVCFSIIDQCDKHCPHCMTASTMRSTPGLLNEEIKTLFNRLKAAGVQRIDVVGGEPFLREDLIELLTYAINLGLEVNVTTHGGLITKEHAQSLAKLGIVVQVSLDGQPEDNDRLRGKGSYEGAIEGMKILRQHEVPVRISCTIQKSNQEAVEHVLEVAKRIGACGVYVNLICAQGRADRLRDKISLSVEEKRLLRRKIEDIAFEDETNAQLLELKRAGRGGVYIDGKGNFISQAQFEEDRKHLGNALTDDIREMWKKIGIDHVVHLLQYLQHELMYK